MVFTGQMIKGLPQMALHFICMPYLHKFTKKSQIYISELKQLSWIQIQTLPNSDKWEDSADVMGYHRILCFHLIIYVDVCQKFQLFLVIVGGYAALTHGLLPHVYAISLYALQSTLI